MNVIGIDVSKASLDLFDAQTQKSRKFSNTSNGFAKLLTALDTNHLVILEATGGYERGIVKALHKAKVPLSVVNPKRVRDFAKCLGKLAKTDDIDAKVLAQFGATVPLRIQHPPDAEVEQLNRLNDLRLNILQSLTQYRNRQEHADCSFVEKSLEEIIGFMETEQKKTERQIAGLIKNSPALSAKAQMLQKVDGVGEVFTATLLGDLPELGHLSNKEIAALVGVAPFNRDSGQWRGQRKISGGRKQVRNVLYMATFRATYSDPEMKTYFEQLRSGGKAFKVAMVACMRKLLVRLNAKMRDFLRLYQPENP